MKIERFVANQDYILITGIGRQQSFEAPKNPEDSRRIAEQVSRYPDEQREIARTLNRLFGFTPYPDAPEPLGGHDPVPEED